MKLLFTFLFTIVFANNTVYSQCAETPTVDAGSDQFVCVSSVSSIALNGAFTGATGGVWSSSGSGSFTDATTMNASYVPSSADLNSAIVRIVLNATGIGTCPPATDTMEIHISPEPVVNAGPDQTLCSGNGNVILIGSSNTGTVAWTSAGTGTFSSSSSPISTYVPSPAETTAGVATLTLTSSGGTCAPVSDELIITISLAQSPTVNAGPDLTICANSAAPLTLNGVFSGSSGAEWSSSGTGVFSPDVTTMNATYTPSVGDLNSSTIRIVLNATGIGSCNPATDTMEIHVTPAPAVNAGPDQTVCSNVASVNLNGSVTIASGGIWTSSGTGTFNNANLLSASYIPSAGDVSTGFITLSLTSTGNGLCDASTDDVIITFTSNAPVANAGMDQTICGNQTFALNGTVTNATGGIWTSSGSGTFSPNAAALNAMYTPSFSDGVAGTVTLTLTSSGNAGCTSVSDNLLVTLTPSSTVDAGLNQAMNSGGVTLNGSVTVATGGTWTSSGSGTFTPNPTTLNATYTPSAGDLAAGSISLTLTSTGNGACTPVSDNMVLTNNTVVCNVTVTSSISNNKVDFSAANSDGTTIGSYFWDFGDGSFASGKFQSHIYTSIGSYNASVHYVTSDSNCSAIIYEPITIASATITTYSISGSITAGGNALDHGTVSLFKLNNSIYDLVMTKSLSPTDNGMYSFSNLENGHYLVHSSLKALSVYASGYTATYFGNVDVWEDAVAIQVDNANLLSRDISLISFTSSDLAWNTGNDAIQGVITFDTRMLARTTAASENPVENATVKLYNPDGILLTSVSADAFGNYKFENLIAGIYFIKVEYAGGSTPFTSIKAIVDGNSSTVTEANTEVLKQTIISGVFHTQTEFLNISMYPNPVSSELNIEVPFDISGLSTLYIYDAVGQLKHSEEYRLNAGDKLIVETDNLSVGYYIIELVIEDKVYKGRITKH